jgi:hypothetical protein
MKTFAKLSIAAGFFVLAMASSRTSYAACNYTCEQTCAARFDNCVANAGGWTESCQRLYDNCAYRCGC